MVAQWLSFYGFIFFAFSQITEAAPSSERWETFDRAGQAILGDYIIHSETGITLESGEAIDLRYVGVAEVPDMNGALVPPAVKASIYKIIQPNELKKISDRLRCGGGIGEPMTFIAIWSQNLPNFPNIKLSIFSGLRPPTSRSTPCAQFGFTTRVHGQP